MKLAIITWFHYRNYGTALQVFALNNVLKEMGHTVDVIRYYPRERGRTLSDFSFSTMLKNVVGHKIAKIIPKKQSNYAGHLNATNSQHFYNEEKERLFDEFINGNLTFSKVCTTLSDLESLNNQYDAFICGSDQIWAPNIFDPHYFLDFVADQNKLVSYAPSIGLFNIDNKIIYKHMSDLIRRFKHLSIREEQGAQIIKKMTGLKAEVVTDPTLLLSADQWTGICNNTDSVSNPYMIVYMLGNEPAHWQEVYRIAEEKKLDVKVIPVFEQDLTRQGCIDSAIGPLEFIALFKNASYVSTDSFHGTIFSLLFHKQFSVFERFANKDNINQNSRVINILRATGLLSRLISFDGQYNKTEEIDFTDVDSLLIPWINKSKQFLINSLNEVNQTPKMIFKNHVLSDHSLCCGCGACSLVCPKEAITIRMDNSGFYRTFINEDVCVNCGKCKTVCQFENDIHGNEMKNGSYYSYKDSDPSVLKKSSSGGAAYRLASLLLKEGYAVAGCTYDISLQKAKHILIEKEEDIYKLQGSKYMQSSFSEVLPLISKSHKPVAIFGTPCQIAAARNLFSDRKDYVYIDLICHGVPSYHLFKKYKQHLNKEYGSNFDKLNISFRYKPKGWRVIHTYTSDGKTETCFNQKEDLYFRMFESMNCYSSACYDCKWRDNTLADLRIGDFWGPLFEKDNTGVSIIGAMTEQGTVILSKIKDLDEGKLTYQPSDNYLKYQQIKNGTKPLFYDELIKRLCDDKTPLSFIVEKYAEPYERFSVNRTPWQRRKHLIRLMLDEK